MKVGDMVQLRVTHVPMFSKWCGRGSGRGKSERIGTIFNHETLTILQTLEKFRGCKVITSSGTTGWIDMGYLELVG
jgi:hypothetical protein